MSEPQPAFLYVEDHSASQKVMTMLLVDMLGYTNLTIVSDAHRLVENLLNNETVYDVIFLDINLDGVSGEKICQELREQPQLTTTKIIAVTAATSPADLRRIQAAGFDGVIAKPLDLNTFSSKLSTILAGEPLWEV